MENINNIGTSIMTMCFVHLIIKKIFEKFPKKLTYFINRQVQKRDLTGQSSDIKSYQIKAQKQKQENGIMG